MAVKQLKNDDVWVTFDIDLDDVDVANEVTFDGEPDMGDSGTKGRAMDDGTWDEMPFQQTFEFGGLPKATAPDEFEILDRNSTMIQKRAWFIAGPDGKQIGGDYPKEWQAHKALSELTSVRAGTRVTSRTYVEAYQKNDPSERFPVGSKVVKDTGDYTFKGTITSIFYKLSGEKRYTVEDDRGVVLIMNEKMLKPRS